MNFISHFYFDQEVDDNLFVVGLSTPDLLSVFDRKVKLNPRRLSKLIQNQEISASQMSFYHGVLRHMEGDRVFHNCNFFHDETKRLQVLLKEAFPSDTVKRSFFVAHVLLELLLDKILIQRDKILIQKFYSHFENGELVTLTEWLTQRPLPGYDEFLNRFISSQYLYRYLDQDYITYVLKRILRQIGLFDYDYLKTSIFSDLLMGYEDELKARCQTGLDDIGKQLNPNPGKQGEVLR